MVCIRALARASAFTLALATGAALAQSAAPSAQATPGVVTRARYAALGVETAPLVRATGAAIEGLPGRVVVPPAQMFVATAPLAGRIEQIGVAVGDAVRAGQVLARIASGSYAELQRSLIEAHARHRLVADALERDRRLLESGIIAQSRFVASETRFAESNAMLAERRQALRLAGMSADDVRRLEAGETPAATVNVVAPSAGVVLEQSVSVGERVEATAPLFRVARLDPLWIEVAAPVDRVRDVREGATVRVAGRNVGGRVIALGRQVAAESQTLTLRVLVAAGGDPVRPGEVVEVTILRPAAADDLHTVPNAALVRDGEKAMLFVESAGGIAPRAVTVIATDGDTSTVRIAAPAGTRIAVRGIAGLRQALAGSGGR